MYKQLRNDGFTLVEIIVSIAIGSVVLAVVLSIIMTSFNYFGNASDAALKRRSLDSLVSYVRSEILNASEVVLSTSKPDTSDAWRCLYTEDNMLKCGKAGHEKNVFGESFYKKNAGTTNPFKLTMTFDMNKTSSSNNTNSFLGKMSYKYTTDGTSIRVDSIKFENLKNENYKFLKDGQLVNLTDDNKPTSPFSLNVSASSQFWKLYYKKPAATSSTDNNNDNVDDGLTHTVADKIYSISDYTNRGYFGNAWLDGTQFSYDSKLDSNYHEGRYNYQNYRSNNSYRIGDCVYYKGYWWMFAKDQSDDPKNLAPDGGYGCWQKLDEYFTEHCYYHTGDVVKDKQTNKYYKCIHSDSNIGWNNLSNTYYWKNLGTEYKEDGYDKQYTMMSEYNLNGIRSLDVPKNSPARFRKDVSGAQPYSTKYNLDADHTYDSSSINNFDTNKYEVGSFVQVKVNNSEGSTNQPYYRLYKKIFQPMKNINKNLKFPGNSVLSGWELCENNYAVGSSYSKGDEMRICNDDIRNNIGKTVDYQGIDEYIKLKLEYSKYPCDLSGSRSYNGYAYYNDQLYNSSKTFRYTLDMPENLGTFKSVVTSWSYYEKNYSDYKNIAQYFYPIFKFDKYDYYVSYYKVDNFKFDSNNINTLPFSDIVLNLNYIDDTGMNNNGYFTNFRDATWEKTSYKKLQ